MADIMYINNKPISLFGAEMQESHIVGGVSVSGDQILGKSRTTFKQTSKTIGEKVITLSLDFYGTPDERAKNKSFFDKECLREDLIINIGDDYEYHVTCASISDESLNDVFTETQYKFKGFRKQSLITVTSNTFYCGSNVPKTDCILSATVGISAARYRLWNAYFLNVSAGDKIVFDGINCRILINGSPRATKCEWVDFPYLVPGLNNIICADPVTVEYYPTFL